MIDWRHLAFLTALLAAGAAPAWLLVERWDGGPAGLVAGALFSLASLALGHHAVRRAAGRGDGAFVAAVFGGALARLLGIGAFALAVAWGTEAHLAVALLTVVAVHVVLGPLEALYLHRTDALA